jgi:hypothetical protein
VSDQLVNVEVMLTVMFPLIGLGVLAGLAAAVTWLHRHRRPTTVTAGSAGS